MLLNCHISVYLARICITYTNNNNVKYIKSKQLPDILYWSLESSINIHNIQIPLNDCFISGSLKLLTGSQWNLVGNLIAYYSVAHTSIGIGISLIGFISISYLVPDAHWENVSKNLVGLAILARLICKDKPWLLFSNNLVLL